MFRERVPYQVPLVILTLVGKQQAHELYLAPPRPSFNLRNVYRKELLRQRRRTAFDSDIRTRARKQPISTIRLIRIDPLCLFQRDRNNLPARVNHGSCRIVIYRTASMCSYRVSPQALRHLQITYPPSLVRRWLCFSPRRMRRVPVATILILPNVISNRPSYQQVCPRSLGSSTPPRMLVLGSLWLICSHKLHANRCMARWPTLLAGRSVIS